MTRMSPEVAKIAAECRKLYAELYDNASAARAVEIEARLDVLDAEYRRMFHREAA